MVYDQDVCLETYLNLAMIYLIKFLLLNYIVKTQLLNMLGKSLPLMFESAELVECTESLWFVSKNKGR